MIPARVWKSNYIQIKLLHAIAHPCPNFNGVWVKPRYSLGHGCSGSSSMLCLKQKITMKHKQKKNLNKHTEASLYSATACSSRMQQCFSVLAYILVRILTPVHSIRVVSCLVQHRACHWDCVFRHNFSGMKRACWTTGSWRCYLSLEVVSSIPAGSTIIHRFICGFICVSLYQSIKIKPTNIYI